MSEENMETQAPNIEGDKTQENDFESFNLSDEEIESSYDEETAKLLKSATAQKKHWRNKFEKQSVEFEELKSKLEVKKEEPKVEKPKKTIEELESMKSDFMNFKLQTFAEKKGLELSEKDIDLVRSMANAQDQSPEEVIQSDFFKTFYNTRLEKEQQSKATPSPSKRGAQPSYSIDDYANDYSKLKELKASDPEKYHEVAKELYKRASL